MKNMEQKECMKCGSSKPVSELGRDGRYKIGGYFCLAVCIKEKRCGSCGEIKPLDQFNKSSQSRDGRTVFCRNPCIRAKSRAYTAANREKLAQRRSLPERIAQRKAYTKTEQYRRVHMNGHYKRKFGISIEQYEGMFRRQLGVCAICKKPNLDGKRLAVDHHHGTGIVRGLLCDICNTTLGKIGESFDVLNAMYDYLERWKRVGAVA